MEIKLIKKLNNKEIFTISKINHVIANTLRRYINSYVPTLAISKVEFKKNSSVLYDQIVAHRLGLIPLTTDLKSYTLPEECKCKGKGCAKCELKMTLKAKGPCTVYTSELKSQDPKVKPIDDNFPITKLTEGQELEFMAIAKLGLGKDHAKHVPGLVIFRGIPELQVSNQQKAKECASELKEILDFKDGKLKIKDLSKWNESHENICENYNIQIKPSKENFLFTIEPWGQLTVKQMVQKALEIFDKKLSEFESQIKKAK